jgi:hypothetical protein
MIKHILCMQFSTKTDQEISLQISSGDRIIAAALSLKYLGLTIETALINNGTHDGYHSVRRQ